MIAPKPLQRRKSLTILAGFKCKDGVVICADTQETVAHSKRSVPKLRFEGPPHWKGYNAEIYESDLAVAFCGAGWGPMIDKVIKEAWLRMKPCSSLEDVCVAAESSIKETFAEFSSIYQPGQLPEVQIIYGVTMDGESRMFSASGPVINEEDQWISGGVGDYMVDFLASKMYGGHLTTRQCVILAAYVLAQAKEHVDGCGGDSHIAVLRERESSGQVRWDFVKHVTEMLGHFDKDFGRLLLESSDLNTTKFQLDDSRSLLVSTVDAMRDWHSDDFKKSRDFMQGLFSSREGEDELGLPSPTQSASHNSEDLQ